ncbi:MULTISPECIES: ATP-binding protein [unclassified Frigoribacterium]|uniref:sensor histidine kinase n=1 Tax=unclassified Frigoribacterium TaxID=2627005 RepID=UPI001562F30C|nr:MULTISPECIES: ATP-binding protein [unclassified Frigoribacterium]NQW86523.1 ATP-binding protein [Frigoribacterium sp. VKM Ac-2860]NQX07854.1 ATP-binding protein [Frigoribacterium sp. VKM Ac-2859]
MAGEGRLTGPLPLGPLRPPRNPISRALLDKVLGRIIAAAGLVFGLQALPGMIGQVGSMQLAWAWVIGLAMFGGFLALVVASLVQRGVTTVEAFVAIAYLIALVTWPLAVDDPSEVQASVPWLWYLCTVATASAASAFSTWIATGYLFVAPAVYGFIRLTPSGGAVSPQRATLDSVYAILLGGAVLILVVILRQAAANVDQAQATAVARYSEAIREHATELERVQVDAIVHDSVLTTFIQAARAWSPEERELSTNMARNAMSHLSAAASTTPFDESDTTVTGMVDRIEAAVSDLGVSVELRRGPIEGEGIPSTAAEALYSAAVQALVNSSQHAGDAPGVRRWVDVTREATGLTTVEVGDTGKGFEPATVPTERLGVRVSIHERLNNAGGLATIDSAPGRGTLVRLQWPVGALLEGGPAPRSSPDRADETGIPEGVA